MARVVLTANTSWYLANFRRGLIETLVASGHDVVVWAPPDEHSSVLASLGCEVVPLTVDRKGTSPVRDGLLLASMLRLLRETAPDAVFSYTVKNNVYGGLAAKALGIPFLPNVSGLGTAFEGETWLSRVVSLLSRAAFGSLPCVIFQNEEDRASFVARGIVKSTCAIRVPGSGVNLDWFQLTPLPGKEEVVFLLLGRLLWTKGVGELVEAVRTLRAVGLPIRCRVLGFLGVDNRAAIDRKTMAGWVAEGVIEYLGHTQDVRPAIASADCVVLPSYYPEGVPRSLLESAAMGRPIITTDTPGCRDAVEQGRTGLLVAPRDAKALADAMTVVAGLGAAARAEMGRAGRERMRAMFDERRVIDVYLDWLQAYARGGGA